MTGFHDPHLIGFLNELLLNVDCIIKVESDEYIEVEETAEQIKVDVPAQPEGMWYNGLTI